MTNQKYELTDETRIVEGRTLYRIRALRNIPRSYIKKGDLGGFIESEANLSHEGECWVDNDACVYERGLVLGDALISQETRISGNAVISGASRLYWRARVSGGARIGGSTRIGGDANIRGNSSIITEDVYTSRNVTIDMDIPIDGDAEITDKRHVFYMGPVGKENWYFLAYRTKGGGACIKRSHSGFMVDDTVEIMDENHEDWQRSDECRALLDMLRGPAGNNHEIKGHDEIPFTVQMMLARNIELNRCNPAGEDESCTKDAEKKLSVGMIRKYELTDETKTVGWGLNARTLYRIRALRDIPRHGVKAGDIGGFIESEANLSHEGDCWIGDKASVYKEARVEDDALVSGRAIVSDLACVCETTEVTNHVRIQGRSRICGDIKLSIVVSLGGDAEVFNDKHIFLVGPIGWHDEYLIAYRSKEGKMLINVDSDTVIFNRGDGDMADYYYGNYRDIMDRYSFLHELARTQPESWPDIEYGFMLQMIRNRIEEWKQDS